MARSPIRRAMASVEGKPSKTSKYDVTFGRGASGPAVEIAPTAIDHILQAGGIDQVHWATVTEEIKHALMMFQEFRNTRRVPTRKQEKETGEDLEAAVNGLLTVLSCTDVERRLLSYQIRDLEGSYPPGARPPEIELAKQALADKRAAIEQIGRWAARMIAKPGWPEHARLSPAKSNPARLARTDLSIRIVRIWQKLKVIGVVKKRLTISETSPFVHFAKEIYGLVGEDTKSFETLKDRLETARTTFAEWTTPSRG